VAPGPIRDTLAASPAFTYRPGDAHPAKVEGSPMNRIKSQLRDYDQAWWTRLGAVGLVVAGLVVALAIATDGAFSRGINGIGALIWMFSLAVLVIGVREGRWPTLLGFAALVTLILSFGVEPTNIATAVPGFAIGGAAIAFVARRPIAWSLMVPALWLPVHLLTAVVPAIIRSANEGEAAVRTDPPPTAAVVPLLMIASAGIAGWLVGVRRERRSHAASVSSRHT